MTENEGFTLASEIASEGGKARAAKLSATERSEIAQKAAVARWGSNLPTATYGDDDHPLRIGDVELPCYVLDDGRRVLVQSGMLATLNMKQGTAASRGIGGRGDRLTKFIETKAINPYVPQQLREMITSPIRFKTPSGIIAHGYEATILADLCDVVLEAREKGKLNYQQDHIAKQCEILVRGFAKIGIIALVDEATGYQAVRERAALQEILDKYLQREFAAWAKTFPDEFYRQIFRLRKWNWMGMSKNRPQCVANYTKDLIYARLAPGILKELEIRNPVGANGRRKGKHFQLLTEEIGHPALAQHMHAVLGLMRAVDSWADLLRLMDRSFPKRGDSLQLPLFTDDQLERVT